MKKLQRLVALGAILLLAAITSAAAIFAASPPATAGIAPRLNAPSTAAATGTAEGESEPGSENVDLPGYLNREPRRRIPGQRINSGLETTPEIASIPAEGEQLVHTFIQLQKPSLASITRSL